MRPRAAVRVLTDEQLHDVHTLAQAKVANYMSDHPILVREQRRIASAAEREILSRAKHAQCGARKRLWISL